MKIVLLPVVALLVLSSGASPAPVAPQTVPAVVAPSYAYTFSPPKLIRASLHDRTVLAVYSGPLESGFASNVNILIDPVQATTKQYVDVSLDAMKQTNPNAVHRGRKTLKVSEKDAELLDYELSAGGNRLRILQLVVAADEGVYVVTCTTTVRAFANYEPEFRKAIDSFKLPEQPR